MANATRYRYWRVLRAVYFHAHKEGKLTRGNPTLLGAQKPGQAPDTREAQILPPRVLELLRDPDSLALLVPSKSEQLSWWVSRDRAAIGLLAHCALTTAELVDLTGADLVEGPGPMRGVGTAAAARGGRVGGATAREGIAQGLEPTKPRGPSVYWSINCGPGCGAARR